MFTLTIVIWMAIGAFAGIFTRGLMGGDPPFGRIGDALLGMVGGALGGILISLIGDAANFVWLVGGVVTSVAGAVLLLWVVGAIKRHPA